MSRYRTAEEIRDEYLSTLGPALGGAFHALYNEVAWLHVKWRQYHTLFAERPEHVDLLNESAPLFFRLLQESLWEDVLLHLSRLTDSPVSFGKRNLTVRALPNLLDDEDVRQRVAVLIVQAVAATEFARDWRNRHIAHRDLALTLREPTTPLSVAKREHVEEALRALAAVVNAVNLHFFASTIVFEFSAHPGDVNALMCVLRDGTGVERARQDSVRRGARRSKGLGPKSAG